VSKPFRCFVGVVLALFVVAGCSDPYSQRRIQLRQQALRDQAGDVVRQERHNAERLRDDGAAVRGWYEDDVRAFRERAAQVGDYAW
jgi:hypothetical protein